MYDALSAAPVGGRMERMLAVIAAALAVALAIWTAVSQRQVAELREQVAALSMAQAVVAPESHLADALTRTGLARAEPAPAATAPAAQTAGQSPASAAASKLASTSPTGFDACARMEAADQAVMKTLVK